MESSVLLISSPSIFNAFTLNRPWQMNLKKDALSLLSITMTDMNIEDEKQLGMFRKVTQFLLRWGIETHG
ncbi:hypothetical protein BYT27DRAFT_7203328 [Phlegmacium glaucopus]|nr:hypothetical protein BYT27DRAFT_7203328 [Phlegmacium glaucopus]